MALTAYASDKSVISSLRKYYNRDEQYNVDFRYWLHTAKKTKDGIMVQIGSRRFLIDEYTGSVIKEIR